MTSRGSRRTTTTTTTTTRMVKEEPGDVGSDFELYEEESSDGADSDYEMTAKKRKGKASKKPSSVATRNNPKRSTRGATKQKMVEDATDDSKEETEEPMAPKSISRKRKGKDKVAAKSPSQKQKPPKKVKGSTQPKQAATNTTKSTPTTTTQRLKKYKFNGIITVGITGAREGDVLHGCAADTANVVLRVDQGTIAAPFNIRQGVEAQIGREVLVQKLAKQFGCSVSVAAMKYNDCPVAHPDVPNHQPLGQACSHQSSIGGSTNGGGCDCEPAARFTILNQGVWQSFAEEHGHGERLKEMVQHGESICYRDILQLVQTPGQPGGKTLILRPKLFQIVQGPVALADSDPRLQDETVEIIDASSWITTFGGADDNTIETKVFEMDQRLFRLPLSASSAPSKMDLDELIPESLKGLLPDTELTPTMIHNCVEALRGLTVGGLKSLLQKTIRFHAKKVDMSLLLGQNLQSLPVELIAVTAAGLLFTESGNFSPELQLYTRGCTSALKRMGVILVEDAWVQQSETAVLGLMAISLATQRMPEYHPPSCAVVATMRLAALASQSPSLVAWRKTSAVARTLPLSAEPVDDAGVQALQQAAWLLRIVKSFPGDMDMMDTVAQMAHQKGSLKLTKADPINRPMLMPLCHCVDQHTYRGIGHIGPSSGTTFAERFHIIFGSTTGFNPRQATMDGFEERSPVKETRFAQQCVARFAFRVPPSAIPKLSDTVTFTLPLDSGTLAAAAGPIPVKVKVGRSSRDILVMLGVRCPEDEIVMLKPARATRDLFGSLTDEERASAISRARTQSLPARSPILKSARTIAFEDGCWRLDGKPWDTVVRAGCTVTVPLVEAPSWTNGDSLEAALSSDQALEEALTTKTDTGLVLDAESLIMELAAKARTPVTLRAISLLRQQYSKVALPTPALDGGLGSDQLVAYMGDWDVYRLLALIARLAPGALRPTMPPNFNVVDANLLRIVERWMTHGMRGDQDQAAGTKNAWVNHPLWVGMDEAEQKLMEHQRCAVASMRRRDTEADTGHFLIMDTGVGKTVTSLCYLYRWLADHGRDETKRIIWVTPKGTVDNLIKQLKGTWSAPVWNVPRVSTAKTTTKGNSNRLILKDYHINVIHADHLRVMIDAGLAEEAPSSVCVFDEVDEMYAPTLRTSAARRLAQLCPKFVAQTATPMRKNENQLLAWLSDTCSFPVDSGNLLVAASGMVSIQLELGIASNEELHLVPMTNDVRKRLRDLLVKRRWLPMAQLVQEHTDAAMVKQAVKLATEDRKKYADGGVLMVADTRDHAEKLIAACNALGSSVRAGGFDTLEAPNAAQFGIVVVPKDKDRGYNSACRLGSMVTGVYAGNGASRHQMRGRLRRLGQRRNVVSFHTVVMENSLLHLLHIRHDAVDSMNISLQELGDKFSADVLRALGEA